MKNMKYLSMLQIKWKKLKRMTILEFLLEEKENNIWNKLLDVNSSMKCCIIIYKQVR